MDHQKGFIFGVSRRGSPIEEGSRDYLVDVYHHELVVDPVAGDEIRFADFSMFQVFLRNWLGVLSNLYSSISQNPFRRALKLGWKNDSATGFIC